ncbi:putative protein tyrosine phosphatase type iva protein 1 [Monocercomonoides exilis]|uniref:putative protein tyrosine phosphatase type iva protein 1 n=1 Tax=Monocercomonoides exilis TaxID=2049356 RepID=UPI00355A067A|nr:putative protein tyrosine phosphatase type iva protein 1 [Monocercomonoides exilis]|eukprot:MONOS_1277.1-p1 / transcript=MONOS_1277.1 / gene=MONOS_1277 / organism=Monocercomonoides_exilis_PA203 / gene_product=protein tyrosine phosphatase type iva protein 1 / transcript_product=protein tyrosine phosphatase type iva protein 1 / location=Mono_scaffold00022:23380-24465(+) / protein_length=276 / sequence_SO=supercontig / SO=protein_coding / is_pseudo=false
MTVRRQPLSYTAGGTVGGSLIKGPYWNFFITDCPTTETLPNFKRTLEKYHSHHLIRVCEPTYEIGMLKESGVSVYDWYFPDGSIPPKWILTDWFDLLEGLRPDIFSSVKVSQKTLSQNQMSHSQSQQIIFTDTSSKQDGSAFASASTTSITSSSTNISSASPSPSSTPSPLPHPQTSPTPPATDPASISPSPQASSVSDMPVITIHCVAGLGRAPLLVALAMIQYGVDNAQAIASIREKRRGALNAKQAKYVLEWKPIKRGTKKANSSVGGGCVIV